VSRSWRPPTFVAELRRIEESPWGEWELTPSKLGRRLREFGITTRHDAAGAARAYRLEDFADAFARYTRQKASEGVNPQVERGFGSDALVDNPSERSLALTCDSDALTPSDAYGGENVPPLCDRCGEPLLAPVSKARGHCERCHLASKRKKDGEQGK
jgi:ribosomal protein S27AE